MKNFFPAGPLLPLITVSVLLLVFQGSDGVVQISSPVKAHRALYFVPAAGSEEGFRGGHVRHRRAPIFGCQGQGPVGYKTSVEFRLRGTGDQKCLGYTANPGFNIGQKYRLNANIWFIELGTSNNP